MKPLFKNITKYNSKNYQKFVDFHNKKYSFSYNLYTIAMSILLIYCIVLNIVEKDFLLMLMFLILLALLLFFRIYLPNKRYNDTKKQYSKNKEISFTFSFYKHYFVLNNKTFYYLKLYKVFETEEYFYLYVDEENAALVNKNGFKVGTSDEFTEFIKKKCLLKYSKQK